MTADAALFVGRTRHVRHRPKRHAFDYRMFSIMLDVDRVGDVARESRVLRHNRFGLVSFHDRDHGDGVVGGLRDWAERQLAAIGRSAPERIDLLCFPRVLGYVFNPLSLWFCRDGAGRTTAVIYEVHNTFGERHAYVASLQDEGATTLRHEADKKFHVSPFFPVQGRYHFTLRPPGDRLRLGIDYRVDGDAQFFAGWDALKRPFSDRALFRLMLSHPLVTLKAIAAIHWEALWIWPKSVRYHPKPDAPHCAVTVAKPV